MSYYGFNESHLNGGEASFGEDVLDNSCSNNIIIMGEGVGLHTNGDDKRAEGLGLSSISICKRVGGCPLYTNGVKAVVDALALPIVNQVNPIS